MVLRKVCESYLLAEILLPAFALLSGFMLSGCKQGLTSDFAKKQQTQEKAVTTLTYLGAKVSRANNELSQNWIVDLGNVPITSEITDQLELLEATVAVLILSKTSIDDKQLANFIDRRMLNGVVELDLSYNLAITDQSLDKLGRLLLLSDINLVGTRVTEAGITRLREQRQAMASKMEDDRAFSRTVQRKFNIHH